MKNRLAEIAPKYTSGDVLAQVEHFQNQFIIQAEQLDILKHHINEHEEYLQHRLNENEVAADRQFSSDSPQIRESVATFERIFNGLRHEFNQFLSKTMYEYFHRKTAFSRNGKGFYVFMLLVEQVLFNHVLQ